MGEDVRDDGVVVEGVGHRSPEVDVVGRRLLGVHHQVQQRRADLSDHHDALRLNHLLQALYGLPAVGTLQLHSSHHRPNGNGLGGAYHLHDVRGVLDELEALNVKGLSPVVFELIHDELLFQQELPYHVGAGARVVGHQPLLSVVA